MVNCSLFSPQKCFNYFRILCILIELRLYLNLIFWISCGNFVELWHIVDISHSAKLLFELQTY